MSDPDPVPGAEAPSVPSSLLQRTALALLRVDLDLLTPRMRQDARQMLKDAGGQFDGTRLVDLCLEGRAGDGPDVLRRAMLALRSRLIGLEMALPRRKPSMFLRLTATLTAKLIFFGLYTFLILVAAYLVEKNWSAANLYDIGDKILSLLRF